VVFPAHLPPDVPGGCCAGEGGKGHRVQAVLLRHLVHQVPQVVVLHDEPAAGSEGRMCTVCCFAYLLLCGVRDVRDAAAVRATRVVGVHRMWPSSRAGGTEMRHGGRQ
jgi:hypothetical protein